MKSFKKRLKDEFDNYSPALKKEILDAPICVDGKSDVYQGDGTIAKSRKTIYISIVAFLLIASLTLMYAFGVFSGKGKVNKFAFTLEINPAVSFITDEDGVVTEVKALNEDADVILCSDSVMQEIKNTSLESAIVVYTDYAVQLGYIDVNSSENAVRFSYLEQEITEIKQKAVDGLEKYFKDKGILSVVVEEELDVESFAKRNGIDVKEDVKQIVEQLEKLPNYFRSREVDNGSASDIKTLYEEKVIATYVLEMVKEQLLNNVDNITKNVQKLAQIKQLQFEIIFHKDNPLFIPSDYWTVIENYNGQYTEEFGKLINDMQRMLNEYSQEYGVMIQSLDELNDAWNMYSVFDGVDVAEILYSLSAEDFIGSKEQFIDMLENVGYNVNVISELIKTPETAEEYMEKFKIMLNKEHDLKKQENKDIYEQEREKISDEKYLENKNSIKEIYGSLSGYFEQIKNKPKK